MDTTVQAQSSRTPRELALDHLLTRAVVNFKPTLEYLVSHAARIDSGSVTVYRLAESFYRLCPTCKHPGRVAICHSPRTGKLNIASALEFISRKNWQCAGCREQAEEVNRAFDRLEAAA